MILSGTEGHVMYNANSYGKLMFAVDTETYKLHTTVYPDLKDCSLNILRLEIKMV